MYEDKTYEALLAEKLSRVAATLDKREGSVIYDAMAPNSLESAMIYVALDLILTETFADTASRTYLVKRCRERGISPNPETYAVGVGAFNMDVPLGARFSCDQYNWAVTEKIGPGSFYLVCETLGAKPNHYTGTLVPVEYLAGLTSAELTEIAINGEDEEDTESLRSKYLASFSNQSYGFNCQQYIDVVGDMPGVGGVKVYRATDGAKVPNKPGHVALVLTDSANGVPSTTLLGRVQTAIDPTQNAGDGIGLAAIDHEVHILAAAGRRVEVRAHFTYATGWDFSECKPLLEAAVKGYLDDLNATWAANASLVVRVAQIETRLLGVQGILDIADTTINGSAENVELGADEIAVFGAVANG